MLVELVVRDLGVIDQLSLTFPSGMIALTGETGAGKTLLIDAISLLMGGRADPGLVRAGTEEATVDGRFVRDGEEYVLSRVVPADGRSRAYINGRPATAAGLAELGASLVDLHGQHSHQSLLGVEAQRRALDSFAKIDLGPLEAARKALRDIQSRLDELGGDPRARARELDLIRYQVEELDAAAIKDADELDWLAEREEGLAHAVEYQTAAHAAFDLLADDSTGAEISARDALAKALSLLGDRGPFREISSRLRDLLAETEDLADTIRSVADSIEQDPDELAAVRERRQQLRDLCRKYGETLALVMEEHRALSNRFNELVSYDERAASLDAERNAALAAEAAEAAKVGAKRRTAAPKLAKAIEAYLPELAMPKAKVGISVDGDDGAQVEYQLSANPGSPLQPLAKVASGGELARAMLALRSVLSDAPPILVFDEVDAGIGGQAGFAVGQALSALGDRHQVLVVTHLPQVAAFADCHLTVEKRQGEDTTVSEIRVLEKDERVAELARMLSGQPDSKTARKHAKELMAEAAHRRSAPTA
ncbi:MAG: DNA repair protein RecN [Acidimicrobiales bacterium]